MSLPPPAGPSMKYILVTGGVISGIGKGVVASSLGVILKHCGVPVTSIKIDPYINIGKKSPLGFLASFATGPKMIPFPLFVVLLIIPGCIDVSRLKINVYFAMFNNEVPYSIPDRYCK